MTGRRRIRYDPSDDLYAVLGVVPTASANEIQQAFRRRAKEVHPDRNRERLAWAHVEFQRINNAYDILGTPELRDEYNQKRYAHQTRSKNAGTTYAAVSREVWKHRHRRRFPGYQFFFFVSLFFVSLCWLAQTLSPETGETPTSANQGIAALVTTTPLPTCDGDHVSITDPQTNTDVPPTFNIKGTASADHFASYEVEIAALNGEQDNFPNWTLLRIQNEGHHTVQNGLLVSSAVIGQIAPGSYVLRLTVHLDNGAVLPACQIKIHVFKAALPDNPSF